MIEWKRIKLSEVCNLIAGYAFKSCDFGDYPKKVVKITNIEPPYVNMQALVGFNEKNYDIKKLEKYRVSSSDYILAMTGATIGKIGRIRLGNAYINQRVLKFCPKKIDNDFLFYILSMNDFSKYIINNIDSESAQANISASTIGKYTFSLPPLDVQKRIAGILGTLDDQIDVLRRENVALEQMAQAVFQSWFVDFDIVRAKAAGTPESEVCEKYHITPELYALFPSALTPDDLPLGWEKLPFSETMKIVSGGTPKTTEAAFWNGNIPWYSVVDAPASVYVLDTEKHITQQGLENSPCSLLKKDTVIISARGTVGKLAMVGKEMAMNQSCYGLEFDFPYYGYLTTKQMLVYLRQNVHGAVFDTITKDTFKTVETVGIPRALQENFTKLVSSFFEKIYKNTQQIRVLSATRDTLLPKLMNGEIEV